MPTIKMSYLEESILGTGIGRELDERARVCAVLWDCLPVAPQLVLLYIHMCTDMYTGVCVGGGGGQVHRHVHVGVCSMQSAPEASNWHQHCSKWKVWMGASGLQDEPNRTTDGWMDGWTDGWTGR